MKASLVLMGALGVSARLDKWGCNPSTGYPHCACKHACIHVTKWADPEFFCCRAEPDDDGSIPPPADSGCDWQAAGFRDTFFDLQMFGKTSGKGYTVSSGIASDTYEYKFGVCEVVDIPTTQGCAAHPPALASASAAFQADTIAADIIGACHDRTAHRNIAPQ